MPSDVLTQALVPASMYPKATVSWEETWGPDDGWGAGEALGLKVVKGNAACKQLVEGHPVPIMSGAVREIQWPDLVVQSYAESLSAKADVDAVMAQNEDQVSRCSTFTVSINGNNYPAKHTLVTRMQSDGAQGYIHQVVVSLGSGRSFTMLIHEINRGNEVMFLVLMPMTNRGKTHLTDVMTKAVKQFSSTVDAYRAEHPASA